MAGYQYDDKGNKVGYTDNCGRHYTVDGDTMYDAFGNKYTQKYKCSFTLKDNFYSVDGRSVNTNLGTTSDNTKKTKSYTNYSATNNYSKTNNYSQSASKPSSSYNSYSYNKSNDDPYSYFSSNKSSFSSYNIKPEKMTSLPCAVVLFIIVGAIAFFISNNVGTAFIAGGIGAIIGFIWKIIFSAISITTSIASTIVNFIWKIISFIFTFIIKIWKPALVIIILITIWSLSQ